VIYVLLIPEKGGSFPIKTSDYVTDNIDLEKIKSYLLQSLNEFRSDYGKPPVKESKWLTKISENYAPKLFVDFEHDYIERYCNKGISWLKIFDRIHYVCSHL
tara:strand:+ start:209 stop:514 length:306 start_codon:yes stop_codon:yes gene_type:complete